jgi:hypothetical protein
MNRTALIAVSVAVPIVWLSLGALVLTNMFVADEGDFSDARQTVASLNENTKQLGEPFQAYFDAVSAASRGDKSYQQITDETADELRALKANLTERRTLNTTLAYSKMRQDGAVETAYQAYVKKERAYLYYVEGYTAAYPAFRSSFVTCADIYEINSKARSTADFSRLHKTASVDCLEDLNRIAGGTFKPTADYAKEFIRIVKGRQAAFDDLASNKLTIQQAGAKIKELGAASQKNDPIDDISDAKASARPDGELDALDEALKARLAES